MPNDFKYDVFLSHSAKDKPVVRELANRLKKDNLRVWFDEWELKPGDSIPAKIEEGLEHSRILVLCMSANAFGSEWAQLEAGTFRFRDPLNKERRFIPLRLDEAPIKGSLAQFNFINWLSKGRKKEYAKLLEACRLPAKPPAVFPEMTNDLFMLALEASAAQVDAEIAATVGRKFIPKLYIKRSAQQDIDKLIHPERELENLLAELPKIGIRPSSSGLKAKRKEAADPLTQVRLLLDSARSRYRDSSRMRGVLRLFLDNLPRNIMGRMHVLTSQAGMGKTNLLCHLAKSNAKQQPTVFLTGRSGIAPDTTIKSLVESKLARYLCDTFSPKDLFEHFVSVAKAKGTSFLVVIDALNEHRDFDVVTTAISHFMNEVAGLPVVILASCREVYWPFFDTSLWPAMQWKLFDKRLDLFSTTESERAITAYFDHYHIVARLAKQAKDKLSHPLILRFFCEAYGDPSSTTPIQLHEIPDIRLKVLFDEYLKRKLDSICHTAPQRFRTPRAVQEFVFRLADRMRTTRRRDVPRDDVPAVTSEQNLESPDSIYVSILGEDILLEEEPDMKTGEIQVVFTYDEFMEYMIARSILRKVTSKEQIEVEAVVGECQNGASEFRSLVGVLEYLAVILQEEWRVPIWNAIDIEKPEFGSAVCRAIGKLGTEYVGNPEICSLEAIAESKVRNLRFESVQRLRLIASSEFFNNSSRKHAIEVLVRVLRREHDVIIRLEAVACFEDDNVIGICEEGRKIATWWKQRKKMAQSMGVVLSDDDKAVLEVFSFAFSRAGWKKIFLTNNAEETLQLVEKFRPALVVTDMTKLGMNGEELAKALKTKPSTSEIPILLVSGTGLRGKEEESRRKLFCGVLMKPVLSKELLGCAEMAIAGKYSD